MYTLRVIRVHGRSLYVCPALHGCIEMRQYQQRSKGRKDQSPYYCLPQRGYLAATIAHAGSNGDHICQRPGEHVRLCGGECAGGGSGNCSMA